MDYIPDYNDLYDAHEAEEERWLSKRPECDCCGQLITDDSFYIIDGTYFCEECLNAKYRVWTDNYIEDLGEMI